MYAFCVCLRFDFVLLFELQVNFRSPATHRMSPWCRRFFLEILPRLLCIDRPSSDESDSNDDCNQHQNKESGIGNGNGIVSGGVGGGVGSRRLSELMPEKSGLMLPDYAGIRHYQNSQPCDDSEVEDCFPPPPPPEKIGLPARLHEPFEPMVLVPPSQHHHTNGNGHTPPPYNFVVTHQQQPHTQPGLPIPPPLVMMPPLPMPLPLQLSSEPALMFDSSSPPPNLMMPDESLDIHQSINSNEENKARHPEFEHALLSVRFVAQHMENLDNYDEVRVVFA